MDLCKTLPWIGEVTGSPALKERTRQKLNLYEGGRLRLVEASTCSAYARRSVSARTFTAHTGRVD